MAPLKLLAPAILAGLALFADPATAVEAEGARAFIEASYVIAPREIEGFTLVASKFDPGNKYTGPTFNYRSDFDPDVHIDVFVYPAGRMDQATAMDNGITAFQQDIGRAVDAAVYSALAMEVSTFAFDTTETPDPVDPADPYAAQILKASRGSSHPEGRKLSISLKLQPEGIPYHSAGYLLYRQLYYSKLRVSAPQSRMDADQFHAFADHAARTLLPAMEAAHVGDCANSTLTIDPQASPEDIVQALISGTSEQLGYNCHQSLEAADLEEKAAAAEVVKIEFEPQEWRAQ